MHCEPITPEPCEMQTGRVLAPLTTWKIGGPADYYAEPVSPEELAWCYRFAEERGLPLVAIGGASNMLVGDSGVRGVVVRYSDRSERQIDPSADPSGGADSRPAPSSGQAAPAGSAPDGSVLRLRVGARVVLARLGRQLARSGWAGLEWAEGIPGTIGGAIVGNAGAYGGEIADRIEEVEVYLPGPSRLERWAPERCKFGYRTSLFKEEGPGAAFVLGATLRLTSENADEILARMDRIRARRKSVTPGGLSCGSVFQNPAGDHAGRIVEKLGLKGHRIGGAEISLAHGNYIVNRGGATAADVRALIRLIQTAARDTMGIELVPEVRFVGE